MAVEKFKVFGCKFEALINKIVHNNKHVICLVVSIILRFDTQINVKLK